ncbi:hypothetical protein E4U17_002028 [Claviceps sp. LM77 group G4]|nr:hypothetical protein E4U17_002028 [Claviceps sp. LM77 group G4]KAG6080668.1 hypothetical protein E4U16_000097 [Claviceps sp. LM84 group G4]KAG6086234.1 hypothetical protein E4U33_007348 [Claviceps sp. LM78 group G4]
MKAFPGTPCTRGDGGILGEFAICIPPICPEYVSDTQLLLNPPPQVRDASEIIQCEDYE